MTTFVAFDCPEHGGKFEAAIELVLVLPTFPGVQVPCPIGDHPVTVAVRTVETRMMLLDVGAQMAEL